MEKARPIGIIGSVITIPLTLYLIIFAFVEMSFGMLILAWITAIGAGISLMYSMSEKRWLGLSVISPVSELADTNQEDESNSNTKSICRECKTEISPSVKRCPSCGWKPKKRGGLWWGTTAVMSLNPVGWAMGAKGASDKYKASKGVSKEIPTKDSDAAQEEVDTIPGTNPTDTLERLNELKEQGAITESEFEEKKAEVLERI